jgi:hypothetical protein
MTRTVELILATFLLVLLAASVLPAFSPLSPEFRWPWQKTLDGLVVVDSPEVYTRERLVNDRFMQTTWLLEQLERYSGGAEFQEVSDVSENRSATGGAGVAGPETTDTDTALASAEAAAPVGPTPGASSIDRFRDEQSFRTEVRQAVLETMLDDRHDLQGNTLYMLKFDASIIPPRRMRNRNFAVVAVDLERDGRAARDGRDGADEGAYATGDGAAGLSLIDPDEELHDVYVNWIDHIRDMVTDEYLNRVRIFLGQKSDEAELVDMWDGMHLDPRSGAEDAERRAETDEALQSLERFFGDYQRAAGFRYAYRQTMRVCSPAPSEGTPAHQDWQQRKKQPLSAPLIQAYFTNVTSNMGSGRPTLSQRMFEQIRRRILHDAASSGGERGEVFAKWLDLVRRLEQSAYAGACDVAGDPAAGAEPLSWCGQLDRILEVGKLGQCDEVLTLVKRLRDEEGVGLDAFFDASSRFYETAAEAWELERFLLFQYLGDYYRQTLDRRLKDLAEFDLVCDDETLLCRILVNQTCPPDSVTREGEDCPAPDAFRDALSPDDAIFFTYAATPKENASAVMARTREQAAMDFAASGSVPGQDDLGGFLRAQQRSAASRVTAGRRVRVMGFAGTGRNDTRPHFGWMIEPPRVGTEAQPVQQSLTAIVSLPSWWQKVRIVVRTCWRGEYGFPEDEVTERRACGDDDDYKNVFTINLPWNVKDINRKLAYDIRRVPFIQSLNGDFGMSFPVYHVGQPKARLLIEGGDLWRSTMVTLGSQRADKILVLPNMRGIVATFEPCRTIESAVHGGRRQGGHLGGCASRQKPAERAAGPRCRSVRLDQRGRRGGRPWRTPPPARRPSSGSRPHLRR